LTLTLGTSRPGRQRVACQKESLRRLYEARERRFIKSPGYCRYPLIVTGDF